MPDGSDYHTTKPCPVTTAVQLALADQASFQQLRQQVYQTVRALGCRIISADRSGGIITVTYDTTDHDRRVCHVPETAAYAAAVPVSDW